MYYNIEKNSMMEHYIMVNDTDGVPVPPALSMHFLPEVNSP